ncbi:MAG TPA: hypothetical protein VGO18_27785 [Steroidobacteraceae bacterium]|nr:hypothetical protein [Steroidobacteraceae bacterium]
MFSVRGSISSCRPTTKASYQNAQIPIPGCAERLRNAPVRVTVICDMFTKASTPWWRATAAVLIVASRYAAELPERDENYPDCWNGLRKHFDPMTLPS